MVSLTLPIVTHVTSSLTLQRLAIDCVNSIMDKLGIVLDIYETRLEVRRYLIVYVPSTCFKT